MPRLLNTLYVTTQDSLLAKEGEDVVLRLSGKTVGQIPIHALCSIVCFGRVTCTPFILDHCARNGVTICWLTEEGRFIASMRGPTSGNVLLRKEQYNQEESDETSLHWSKNFITGKIYNCRAVLLRSLRDHPDIDHEGKIAKACQTLQQCLKRIPEISSLDLLRGIEGDAAKSYFEVFNLLLRNKDTSIQFKGRSKRPPLDPVNCLLSFFYTLLVNDIRGALESVGLDPQAGFLHQIRPGRASLALDLMEEFRPVIADRLTLSLLNLKQLALKDFKFTESGAVLLTDKARKKALLAYHRKKEETVIHPFLKEKMPVGLLWHIQAQLFAKCIRGELEEYPPYVMR